MPRQPNSTCPPAAQTISIRGILPLIPASFFGIVLGLGGLANSWRLAHRAWGYSASLGEGLFVVAAVGWAALSVLYLWKWIAAFDEAIIEARHPIQCCFIGLGGVATMVMAQGALPYSKTVAFALFASGGAFTLAFAIWRTGLLWQGERSAEANTPVLFLPVVAGGFVFAITAGALGLPDIATLAFGAAFFSWLAIESVVLHRLYTAATLKPELRPTLGIVLAPPAVGSLACLATGAEPAQFVGQILIGYGILQALLFARLWRWISEGGFAPSYWAVTFGATALPSATMKVAISSPTSIFSDLATVLFVIGNLVVLSMAVRTLALWLGGRATHASPPTEL